MKELSKILEGILDAPDKDADKLITAKHDQQQIQADLAWVKKIKGDGMIARYEAAAVQTMDALLEAADDGKYDEYDLYRVSGFIKGLCYWQCFNYTETNHWSEREYDKFYYDEDWWDGFLSAKPGSGYWRLMSNSSAYNYILDHDYTWTIVNQDRELYDATFKKYLKQIQDIAKKYGIKIY